MIPRPHCVARAAELLDQFPVVALIGARQVGKSTLARSLAAARVGAATTFDLEDPAVAKRLEDPTFALEPLTGLVVLDEIHRSPELFPVLRVLADRRPLPARFLVLGSASEKLLKQSSESLAGRVAYCDLGGFELAEVGGDEVDRLWQRGGFPDSFTAATEAQSFEWRRQYLRSFVERELPELGIKLTAPTMHRFLGMLAHWHGQTWNASEFGRAFGVTNKTVDRYLDILVATFQVRRLEAFRQDVQHRHVKAPRIYVADSGLLHAQLGLESADELMSHPKVGASFEGFAIQQLERHLKARSDECFYWRLHTGAELDFLVVKGERRLGFDVQLTSAPSVRPSMKSALEVLNLERLDVVHAGTETYPLAPKIRAVSVRRLLRDVEPLR